MNFITKSSLVFAITALFVACGSSKIDQQVVLTETEPFRIKMSKVTNITPQILVFTKTAGFRHKSIEKGVETLKEMGVQNNFGITQTEDSLVFTTANLKKYQLVLFLNTTGDVLGEEQEKAVENYIQQGGSFLGVHSATDTEYKWPWYGKMVGAYFENHPKQQEAKINVFINNHPATKGLKNPWSHFDEWYNFKNLNPDVNVLLKLDESSYEGGTNGDYHPIAWFHEYDGGRAFYTGLGHTEAAYDDADFRQHLLGGIEWCLGR
ncbi:MAG: ThuA domain-containing protein [Cellulophaga sp.]|nr:ThuA domain-containing protein [Cellulophaga sp.]